MSGRYPLICRTPVDVLVSVLVTRRWGSLATRPARTGRRLKRREASARTGRHRVDRRNDPGTVGLVVMSEHPSDPIGKDVLASKVAESVTLDLVQCSLDVRDDGTEPVPTRVEPLPESVTRRILLAVELDVHDGR